jgi:hypothetical protein
MSICQRLYWIKRTRADGTEEKSKIHLFSAGERHSLCGRRKPTGALLGRQRWGLLLCRAKPAERPRSGFATNAALPKAVARGVWDPPGWCMESDPLSRYSGGGGRAVRDGPASAGKPRLHDAERQPWLKERAPGECNGLQ